MAICLYLFDSQKQAQCQKRNREARQARIETRQGGRTDRVATRQSARTDRTEARVEGGATIGQGIGNLGAGVASVFAPPPTVAPGAGGISSSTLLLGGAALAAALLITSK